MVFTRSPGLTRTGFPVWKFSELTKLVNCRLVAKSTASASPLYQVEHFFPLYRYTHTPLFNRKVSARPSSSDNHCELLLYYNILYFFSVSKITLTYLICITVLKCTVCNIYIMWIRCVTLQRGRHTRMCCLHRLTNTANFTFNDAFYSVISVHFKIIITY